jgi:peptide/nickel transport system ATP-binding protein
VQSQVLNLLRTMQDELKLTYCFISHDLAVVRHMSDRIAVMHRGSLVEEGKTEDIFTAPRHPYTRLLLESVPDAGSPGALPLV